MTEIPKNLLTSDERWPSEKGPVIRIRNVCHEFDGLEVLKGVDLDIEVGKTTVIVGVSGSGKSVLMKIINGLLKPTSGSVEVFGSDVTKMNKLELQVLRRRLSTMFQNYALFDSMTVVENVSFPVVQNKALKEKEANLLSSKLLTDLGLADVQDAYPSALSGGMKKRVALARTIVSNPEVVLFDDPTTGLDPVMTEFVDQMLLNISKKYHLTSVIVSHNMASTFRLADTVAVLHQGKIIAVGEPKSLLESTDPNVLSFVDRISIVEDNAAPVAKDNLNKENAETIVNIKGLRKSFGEREILKGVDFEVTEGSISVLIGGSGAGKSVLMKHILGIMTPDTGLVELFGKDISTLKKGDVNALRSKIGMLFQHSALFDSMSVGENVAFPLVERRLASEKEAKYRALEILKTLKIEDLFDRMPADISNGQQKRVALCRALITEPKLMVYDEPTTGQDPIMSEYVEEMIVDVHETFDFTSIIISHDMASTFRIAHRVAMLYRGEIIAEGPPKTFLESEDERVREFVFASQMTDL